MSGSIVHSISHLRIQLLCVLQVTGICDGTSQVTPLTRAQIAHLMGYLALAASGPVPHSPLAGISNPELSPTNTRPARIDALYCLRSELGKGAHSVCADADCVALDTHQLRIGIQELRRCTASNSPEAWRTGLDSYADDLLEDQDAEWPLAPLAARAVSDITRRVI